MSLSRFHRITAWSILAMLVMGIAIGCGPAPEPEPSGENADVTKMRPGARRTDGRDFSNR